MWVGVVEGLGVVGMWCVASAVSVVGRWLGVCVCGTWLCGEKNTRTLGGRLQFRHGDFEIEEIHETANLQ